MAQKGLFGGAAAVVLSGVFYQFFLKDLLFTTLGISRQMQPFEDFGYECQRLYHPLLECCEDMWLDNEDRKLYAACSDLYSRTQWLPSTVTFNATARGLTDHVAVIDIDSPGDDGLYGVRQLEVYGDYKGSSGGKDMDLHGFDVEILSPSRLRFWMINHRPPVNSTSGDLLNANLVGSNSTVEVFDLARGSLRWEYVKTIANAAVATPNKLAATGNGGFVAANDHSAKTGIRREFDILLGGGSLASCGADNECRIGQEGGFNFPNGIVRGVDGLYYVPSSITGKVSVHALQPDLTLKTVDEINVGMPMDNLAVDAAGDMFAGAFPKGLQALSALTDPSNAVVASTIWRIRKKTTAKGKTEYEVEKFLEDKNNVALNMITTARHDTATGRLFLSGPLSKYITVCEKQHHSK